MPRPTQEQIKQYLFERDKKLARVIESVPYPKQRQNRDVYQSLVRSIISQQLSVKAARTIHDRLLDMFPDRDARADLLMNTTVARLRKCGLSARKVEYLKGIARTAQKGELDYSYLSKKSDDDLVEELTRLHGIGRWTVEMLMMFTFDRKDIFPVADVGIQNSMRSLYRIRVEGKAMHQRMTRIAESWKPYRTIACRYLWAWKSQNL